MHTEFRLPEQTLTQVPSSQAIQDGYGHTCKMKTRREELEREEAKNQYSFFEEDDDNG